MTRLRFVFSVALLFTVSVLPAFGEVAKEPMDWAMRVTLIEACSCPMFCQCFFNAQPAAHHDHATGKAKHFCQANIGFRVDAGHYGKTALEGAKWWVAGDLGDNIADGEAEWSILHFDPAVTPAQREGILAIMPKLYSGLKFKSSKIGEDLPIEWSATKDRAVAKLNGGKTGEMVLTRFAGMTSEPVVIRNLKYVGAPRNDGFVLMPNEIEAYRAGDQPFEFKGTNGFMITLDAKSSDYQ